MNRSTSPASAWSMVARVVLGAFPRRMALGVALATLTVLAGMGLLGLSGWFITATAIAGLQVSTALAFDVFMPSAGIRLLALGRTVSRYGERLVTHDATLATLAVLREHLFRGWASGPVSRTGLRRPARVLFRLTSDLDALESLYLRLIVPAGAALGAALLSAIILGLMNPWLGLALGTWMLTAGWGVMIALSLSARRPTVRRSLATERLRAHVIDLVSGQTELIMVNRLERQTAALARADRRLGQADQQLNRLDIRAGAAYGVAGGVTLALVLLSVGHLVEQGQLSTPAAALALLLALAAMEPFSALRRGALEVGRVWLAGRRLSVHLTDPRAAIDVARQAPPEGPLLQMHNVSVRHPDSHVNVLTGISLTLGPAERVAVVGPSGSGKSTLMALIAGELPCREGSIRVGAHSWLTQRIDLFQDSLRDNLRLAAPDASDVLLWNALEAAGLKRDVQAMPAGLDTRLGEAGLGLSGGQARRLALARMLLQPHRLWLLDEPTEALDAATAADVLAKLDTLGAGRAWLLATHLRREAALADRLLVLRAGRIETECVRGSPGFDAALTALRPD